MTGADKSKGFGVAGAIGSTCFTWGNYFGVFVEDYGSYLRFASFECSLMIPRLQHI